ncbi:MAG: TSUP family transporter [Paracoccaceae bacterium]
MTIVELPALSFAIIAIVVLCGVVVQRISGQGLGMIAAPVVAMIAPEFMPATLILLGGIVGAAATSMDISAVNWAEARAGFVGRAFGAFAGAGIALLLVDQQAFGIVVAVIVLTAVALSLLGLHAPISRGTLVCAGLTAGVMGTITAIGAPPMAILYAQEEARRSRAMQNLFFLWGMIWSCLALIVTGLVDLNDILLAACLFPVVMCGLWLARPAARMLEGRSVRPIGLGLSTIAALTLLGRSL